MPALTSKLCQTLAAARTRRLAGYKQFSQRLTCSYEYSLESATRGPRDAQSLADGWSLLPVPKLALKFK